jgi:hypothetical protein
LANYTWKVQPTEHAFKIDSFYAKNISRAWINWELSQLGIESIGGANKISKAKK